MRHACEGKYSTPYQCFYKEELFLNLNTTNEECDWIVIVRLENAEGMGAILLWKLFSETTRRIIGIRISSP